MWISREKIHVNFSLLLLNSHLKMDECAADGNSIGSVYCMLLTQAKSLHVNFMW